MWLSAHAQAVGRSSITAGIVAAHLGARHVILSDLPENIPLLQKNLNANATSKEPAEQQAQGCAHGHASREPGSISPTATTSNTTPEGLSCITHSCDKPNSTTCFYTTDTSETHSAAAAPDAAPSPPEGRAQRMRSAGSGTGELPVHRQAVAAVPLSWGDPGSLSTFQRQCLRAMESPGTFRGSFPRPPTKLLSMGEGGRDCQHQEDRAVATDAATATEEDRTVTFDVVIATDVFYYEEGVRPLLWVLERVCSESTLILLACGRNRRSFPLFQELAKKEYDVRSVEYDALDPVYRCLDVGVHEMRRRTHAA